MCVYAFKMIRKGGIYIFIHTHAPPTLLLVKETNPIDGAVVWRRDGNGVCCLGDNRKASFQADRGKSEANIYPAAENYH